MRDTIIRSTTPSGLPLELEAALRSAAKSEQAGRASRLSPRTLANLRRERLVYTVSAPRGRFVHLTERGKDALR